MAQPLKSINLIAPAFKGLNTEDAALAQDPSFAEVADNAVIDNRGRLASRKGQSVVTTTKTVLGSEVIRQIHEFRDSAGNTKMFSVGNNKIMSGETTLVDESPGSYTISNDNWKMVNFNDHIYFFQAGQEPLVYSNSLGSVTKMSAVSGGSGMTSAKYGNEVLAAYGRLWTADIDSDPVTVYWSDTLSGHVWTGGTSGSLDLTTVWPNGYDEVKALAAYNDYLVIFGENSILVYQGAEDPSTMTLADTVPGVGCVDRDTVQATGSDLIFLSHTGLRSFGRTIQEKSMPISRLSKNIARELVDRIDEEADRYISVYHPEEKFYLLGFTGQDAIYCFDVRGMLEDGSYRVTRWPGTGWKCFHRPSDHDLRIGDVNGISKYSGYQDNGAAYRFKYESPELTFGDPAVLKFLKKLRPTIIGGNGDTIAIKWSYDFETFTGSQTITPSAESSAEYNISEFNIAEYSSGRLVVREAVNATGSGSTLAIKIESDISGTELSIQEINVLALTGKTL